MCVGVCCVCVCAAFLPDSESGMFSALATHTRTEALQTLVPQWAEGCGHSEGLKEVLVMSHIKYDFSDTEPKYF